MLEDASIWDQLFTSELAFEFIIAFFIIIPIGLATAALAVLLIFRSLRKHKPMFPEMRRIHGYIRSGAQAYLKRQAKTLVFLAIVLFLPVGLTGYSFLDNPALAVIFTGGVYCIGAISSLFAGYLSMDAATRANILVIEASTDHPMKGFKTGFLAGMISGIMNMSVFVLGIWLLFIITQGNIRLITSYSFGASTASLLAQVGGGIFTKSADMGADLVGKFEIGIEEDDPRNPAIIADAVGDNVGDCAGRGADLFESASSDAVGGMVLGLSITMLTQNPVFIITNLTLLSLGIIGTYVSVLTLSSRIDLERNPSRPVWLVFFIATLTNFGILAFVNLLLFKMEGLLLFMSCMMGLMASLLSIIITIYYTDAKYKPTYSVASASQEGPAINAVAGLSVGIESIALPMVVFGVAIIFSYMFGYWFGDWYYASLESPPMDEEVFKFMFGVWGIALASVSSDMIISTILSFDTFGPIMDNAAGITQMAKNESPRNIRSILDKLDATGNTTKAIAKGFALVCGGLTSVVMFETFVLDSFALSQELPTLFIFSNPIQVITNLDLTHPLVILGLIIGTMLPFLFASQVMKAVNKGASAMVREVRFQFETIPGLKEGNGLPDYKRCVDISAKNALKTMVFPVILIIAVPIIFGICFGPFAHGGFLLGNLMGCLIVGLFMTLGGASFDNAKKAIEGGLFGGKGTPTHKAAIIGDTIGDPLKDSAGPSMNIQITLINSLSLTFLPTFIITGWVWFLVPFV